MTRRPSGMYRGASPEERRSGRRRRLMDAALDIIGTHGWSAATVRAVCEHARVGPRFFYESFDDIDALAAAVHDETVQRALANTLNALAAAPDELHAKTRVAVETIITGLTDDPRRARLTFAEAHGSETLMRRRFTALRSVSETMVEHNKNLLNVPTEDEKILRSLSLLLTGGITELVLVWLHGDLDEDRDELITFCTEFVFTTVQNLPTLSKRLH